MRPFTPRKCLCFCNHRLLHEVNTVHNIVKPNCTLNSQRISPFHRNNSMFTLLIQTKVGTLMKTWSRPCAVSFRYLRREHHIIMIRSYIESKVRNCDVDLPILVMALQATENCSTGSNRLMLEKKVVLPVDIVTGIIILTLTYYKPE